jgi:hypothetical protein
MSSTIKRKPEGIRLVTQAGRIAWPNITEPQETPNGPRYNMTLLLPPTYDLAPLKAALVDICERTWGKNRRDWPAGARMPEDVIRDAGTKTYAGYEKGWHFFAAATAEKPSVVDAAVQPVTDPKEIYAGRWARISVRPYCYDNKSSGVSFGLSNIQLLQHDTVFGRTSASQDFDLVALDAGTDF